MRVLLTAAAMAMLSGCSSFDNYAMSDGGSPMPRPHKAKPPEPPRESSTVERWTREQRHCEAGDRKDQRRCIMPYPAD